MSDLSRRGFLGRLLGGLAVAATLPAFDLVAPGRVGQAASIERVPTYENVLSRLAWRAMQIFKEQLPKGTTYDLRDADSFLGHTVYPSGVVLDSHRTVNVEVREFASVEDEHTFVDQAIRPIMVTLAAGCRNVKAFGNLELPTNGVASARAVDPQRGISVRLIQGGYFAPEIGDWIDLLRVDILVGERT